MKVALPPAGQRDRAITLNRSALLLGGILVGSLALRLWGIQFGLPYLYHYDEHFYVNTALKLGAGVLHNPPYAPTAYSNLLFIEYAAYYVLGRLFGVFPSAATFEAQFRSDPTMFYLLARVTTALMGLLTVAVVYWLGKEHDEGRRTKVGVIAPLVFGVTFLHVRDSHYAVPDVPMTLFVALAVLFTVRAVRTGRLRDVVLSGLTGGFAIATKWSAFPVAAPVILAVLLAPAIRGRRQRVGLLLASVAALAIGFALVSPQVLLNPAPYLAEAQGQAAAGAEGGFGIWSVDTVSGWLFYLKTLLWGVGPVALVLALVGLALMLQRAARRDRRAFILLIFPILYYFLMGSTRHYFARYAVPLLPFLALFAAEAVIRATGMSKRFRLHGQFITALVLLAALAGPLAASIRHGWLLTKTDTRTVAKDWIERNLPSGAKIAMDWQTHGPPLATPEETIPDARREFAVTTVGESGLAEHPLDWYREQGYEFLVVSSFISEIRLTDPKADAARRIFYASLSNELPLLASLSPSGSGLTVPFIFDEIYGPAVSVWLRERPGPMLRIYRVDD